MIATFTPERIDERTILKNASGHALTVNVRPGSSSRVVLIVSDEDVRQLDTSRRLFSVRDLMTGMDHLLTRDDCGAGCKCAITFAH